MQITEIIQQAADNAVEQMGTEISADEKKIVMDLALRIFSEDISPKEAMGFTNEMLENIYGIAYKLCASGKFEDSCKIFKYLRSVYPNELKYTYGIALCYHQMKDYEKAIANYMICHYFRPNEPIPLYQLYDCFIQLNDLQAAFKTLKALIKEVGKNPQHSKLKERAKLSLKSLKEQLMKIKTERNKK